MPQPPFVTVAGVQVICNPTHITCHATPETANPVVPGQKYVANLDHFVYSVDAEGRSFLELHVNVEN